MSELDHLVAREFPAMPKRKRFWIACGDFWKFVIEDIKRDYPGTHGFCRDTEEQRMGIAADPLVEAYRDALCQVAHLKQAILERDKAKNGGAG